MQPCDWLYYCTTHLLLTHCSLLPTCTHACTLPTAHYHALSRCDWFYVAQPNGTCEFASIRIAGGVLVMVLLWVAQVAPLD